MDWQPIETAPKDGTRVLLLERGRVDIGHYDKTERTEHGRVTYKSEGWWTPVVRWPLGSKAQPTHWMPLPAPPAGSGPDHDTDPSREMFESVVSSEIERSTNSAAQAISEILSNSRPS